MKGFSFAILFFVFTSSSKGQEVDNPDIYIQDIFNQLKEGINYDEFYENLIQYYYSPLDLNKASQEDLENLHLLNSIQIKNFFEYRLQSGTLISLYELQSIPEFDILTIKKILPFISINNSAYSTNFLKRISNNRNHYLLFTNSTSIDSEDQNNSYAGDNNKISIRYRNSKVRDFSYGFCLKKDPGEKLYVNTSKQYYLFDFNSFHFSVYERKSIKAIIVGDYHVQFGQGLILAGGFNMGKSSEVILSIKRNNTGIRSHSSTTEFGYFRGSAITIQKKQFEFTGFASSQKIDASFKNEGDEFTILSSGYHRTENELANRKNVLQTDIGGNISFNNNNHNFHLGITNVFTHFNKSLIHSDQLYNLYAFSGNNNFIGGLDFSYIIKNINVFGESAVSSGGGKGIVAGLISSLSSKIEASLLIRNYSKDFHSFYGNALSESTNNINEKGIYWGIKYKLKNSLQLAFYVDRFNFPWLKYQVNAPSQGNELLGRLTYTPNKTTNIYLQWRNENKEKNYNSSDLNITLVEPYRKNNFTFCYQTSVANLMFRSRIQFSTFNQKQTSTRGFAIAQDLEYKLRKFLFSYRIALFDTDDFENRQYVYEREVMYSFSVPFYYTSGIRTYLMIRYKIFKNIDLWIRYARTAYQQQDYSTTSADNDGRSKDEIKIQLKVNF